MPNDSSTGGFLGPASPAAPAHDLDLDLILQALVAGVTGLPGAMVRPRWQPTPPKQPEAGSDWCAVGVTNQEPNNTPAIEHEPGGDRLTRHEAFEALASFYGPNAGRYAAILRDGLYIPQNRETLDALCIALVDVGATVSVPALMNQINVRRADVRITFRRGLSRLYAVRDIAAADATLITDTGLTAQVHVSP